MIWQYVVQNLFDPIRHRLICTSLPFPGLLCGQTVFIMATAGECGALVLCILKNSQSDSKRARILLCPIVTLVRLAVQCGGEICGVTWDKTRFRYWYVTAIPQGFTFLGRDALLPGFLLVQMDIVMLQKIIKADILAILKRKSACMRF